MSVRRNLPPKSREGVPPEKQEKKCAPIVEDKRRTMLSNRSDLEHYYPWLTFLLIGFLLSSCTPTTGTRVSLSQSDLAKIKRIGILVKEEESFSVRLSREEATNVGAAVLGLVGAGIEAGIRSSADTKIEEELKPILGNYDPKKLMQEKLYHYIEATRVFSPVTGIDVEDQNLVKGTGLDGLLEVTLKQWGLRLCLGPRPGEQVQVGLSVHGKMYELERGNTVWERNELYLDGKCYPLGDFRSRGSLLKDAISRSIDTLSGRIVNYIVFP